MNIAYILFAHGSRVESANEAVRAVAEELERAGDFGAVAVAFLDCAPPDLTTTIDSLAARGADRIAVIPYFLTLGRHAAEDLPRIVREASRIHTGVRIEVAPPLDGHPALLRALRDRAHAITGEFREGQGSAR